MRRKGKKKKTEKADRRNKTQTTIPSHQGRARKSLEGKKDSKVLRKKDRRGRFVELKRTEKFWETYGWPVKRKTLLEKNLRKRQVFSGTQNGYSGVLVTGATSHGRSLCGRKDERGRSTETHKGPNKGKEDGDENYLFRER